MGFLFKRNFISIQSLKHCSFHQMFTFLFIYGLFGFQLSEVSRVKRSMVRSAFCFLRREAGRFIHFIPLTLNFQQMTFCEPLLEELSDTILKIIRIFSFILHCLTMNPLVLIHYYFTINSPSIPVQFESFCKHVRFNNIHNSRSQSEEGHRSLIDPCVYELLGYAHSLYSWENIANIAEYCEGDPPSFIVYFLQIAHKLVSRLKYRLVVLSRKIPSEFFHVIYQRKYQRNQKAGKGSPSSPEIPNARELCEVKHNRNTIQQIKEQLEKLYYKRVEVICIKFLSQFAPGLQDRSQKGDKMAQSVESSRIKDELVDLQVVFPKDWFVSALVVPAHEEEDILRSFEESVFVGRQNRDQST